MTEAPTAPQLLLVDPVRLAAIFGVTGSAMPESVGNVPGPFAEAASIASVLVAGYCRAWWTADNPPGRRFARSPKTSLCGGSRRPSTRASCSPMRCHSGR